MGQCDRCGQPTDEPDAICQSCLADQDQPTATFTPVMGAGSVTADSSDVALEAYTLTVTKGPQVGDYFELNPELTTVGRNPKADIFLNDQTVSRDHAELIQSSEVVIVRDRGSLNGTYVNGTVVDEAELRDGDRLQIGTFQLTFRRGR